MQVFFTCRTKISECNFAAVVVARFAISVSDLVPVTVSVCPIQGLGCLVQPSYWIPVWYRYSTVHIYPLVRHTIGCSVAHLSISWSLVQRNFIPQVLLMLLYTHLCLELWQLSNEHVYIKLFGCVSTNSIPLKYH